MSQNTVAIALPAEGCVLNLTRALPIGDFELYSLAQNNGPKSHLLPQGLRKVSSIDLNRLSKALQTDALVAICSSLSDFG